MRLTIIAAAVVLAMPAAAQTGKVKIGFVNTFSGPNAFIGNGYRTHCPPVPEPPR
jgi:ethanolamine utilization microcompartment shell protein EutS